MSAGSKGWQVNARMDCAEDPLAPLNHEAVDWADVFQRYRKLPPRERQVLDLVIGRRSQKQIASELQISHATVRNHVASIKQRFSAPTLPDLAILITGALFEEARRIDSHE